MWRNKQGRFLEQALSNIIKKRGFLRNMTGNGAYQREILFLPQFITWKQSLRDLPADLKEFEKWLFKASSKVLFGEKPGELLLLREKVFNMDINSLLERAEKVVSTWGLAIYTFGLTSFGPKIVIYHRQRVNRVLKETAGTPFFIHTGYSDYSLAEDFFSEIARRWKSTGEFPHEIAVALGYPVKDVVGYLGIARLEYVGSYGWRVYGNPQPSLKLRDKYNRAKEAALRFLEDSPGEAGDGQTPDSV